jgi:phage shock protein PspC (stress-responsive transcriptional regulator)
MESKRLYRSITDRKIAGVAGGLGEYFVMDPLLIRLIFVILLLAGGGGFLIYLVLWIVTPENPNCGPVTQNQPSGGPQPSYRSEPGTNSEQEYYETAKNEEGPASNNGTDPAKPQKAPKKKQPHGSLVGGLVLITLGALFLADELIPEINFGDLWPIILVAIGTGLLINAFTSKKKETNK